MAGIDNHFNGMLVINKEEGYTSSDVVAKLRGILHMRKIGHTGTLDPYAVGVLPVCLGMGTKLAELIADRDKEYLAVLRLGVTTDTQDMTGSVLTKTNDDDLMKKLEGDAGKQGMTVEQYIKNVCCSFTGEIDQIPPMYSAVWINGRRLYELAREGQVVERKPRRIRIISLDVEKTELPFVTFRVVCSKGTYIRTLCEDIGAKLGVGGAMEHLTRTRVGIFRLEDALTLRELEAIINDGEPVFEDRNGNMIANNTEAVKEHIIPIDSFFTDVPEVHVKKDAYQYLRNGNPLSGDNMTEGSIPNVDRIRVYDEEGSFWALYHYDKVRDRILPTRMFHETDSCENDPGVRK